MAAEAVKDAAEEALLDYDDEEEAAADAGAGAGGDDADQVGGGEFTGVHSSSFRDFYLKPEILRATVDCGFEHPSRVQHEAIPQALLGTDLLCQAKAGMGKTAVFVLSTLNQMTVKDETSVLVLCHTRELAYQIGAEYERFSKHLPEVKTAVLFGGVPARNHIEMLRETTPHVVVGTPGRVFHMAEEGVLDLSTIKFFVLDECDRLLEEIDMRRQVQRIFVQTPPSKQCMMFSATLSEKVKEICRRYMQDPYEIIVKDGSKLTLRGLKQYYVELKPEEKNRKLNDLLDALEFNQVVIFVSGMARARELDNLLRECNFPSIHIHGKVPQKERIKRFTAFKNNEARIMVSTQLLGRGVDIERVNIVINYDFPQARERNGSPGENPADQYLHRVGRAGRFGTKGLAISFVSTDEDKAVLKEVQDRFAVDIPALPDAISTDSYM